MSHIFRLSAIYQYELYLNSHALISYRSSRYHAVLPTPLSQLDNNGNEGDELSSAKQERGRALERV